LEDYLLFKSRKELNCYLREYYRQQGRVLTSDEAEALKLSDEGWHDLEFAKHWRQSIKQHVQEYVRGITDRMWLPREVALQVIVTGGSGVVSGLKSEIRDGVCEGLQERGIDRGAINATNLRGEALDGWDFSDEIDCARRAVSIGASDPHKPTLRPLSKLE
jgi:hypothetical protein